MKIWLVLFLFSGLLFRPFIGAAQRQDPMPPFMIKTLDKVTAVLDPLSGRFSVKHHDGRTILFHGVSTLTSHISVKIGSRVYSNYRWVVLNTDPSVANLGKGVAESLTDRLRYSWILWTHDGEFAIVQDLIPVTIGERNEVHVRIAVENRGAKEVPIGISLVLDVDVAGNDNAPIVIGETKAEYERAFRNEHIPDCWFIDEGAFMPDTILGKLAGDSLTKPDVLIPGRWTSHGRLGTAVYGYTPGGQYVWDTALFLQWDERTYDVGRVCVVRTSVGLKGQKYHQAGTFGRKFYLGDSGAFYLCLITEETATVKMSLPVDAKHEKVELRDGKWDTTFVLQPYKPYQMQITSSTPYKKFQGHDSVLMMQQAVLRIEADEDIAVMQGRWEGYEVVLPIEHGDTAFMITGYWPNITINTLEEETTVYFTPRSYPGLVFSQVSYNWQTPPDATTAIAVPPRSRLELSGPRRQTFMVHPYDLPDGSGSLIRSDKPICIYTQGFMGSVTGTMDIGALNSGESGRPRDDLLLPISWWGKEYVVIPYRKDYPVKRTEDFVRIVAAYDSTDVSFYPNNLQVRLQRGERFDTLLGSATVIKATKPISVLQTALWWKFMGSPDSLEAGGTITLLPVERWGRKYFPFVQVWKDHWDKWNHIPGNLGLHYLRIIVHKDSAKGITVNGNPISPDRMQLIGDYLFTDVLTAPAGGLYLAQSKTKFTAFSYGWARYDNRALSLNREGTIPPYKP